MIAPIGPRLPDVRVLLVEDDDGVRASLVDLLEAQGAAVTACVSAEEAVQRAATGQFDVVLSDVMMDGMGGRGLFDWLLDRRPDLSERFVFMTAEPLPVLELAARAGRPLLEKPFTSLVLLETCRDVADAQ